MARVRGSTGSPGVSAPPDRTRGADPRLARDAGRAHPRTVGRPAVHPRLATGAEGEERLGRRLDNLAGPWLRVLRDRRIRGSRADIDHVVVCPRRVFVIDASSRGRARLRVEGGILRARTERLMAGGRDRGELVDGVIKQLELVRAALRRRRRGPRTRGSLFRRRGLAAAGWRLPDPRRVPALAREACRTPCSAGTTS
jgi:hypothetical protein